MSKYRITGIGWLVAMITAIGSAQQVPLGENVALRATGNLSAGYTADYSSLNQSDHGFTFGGDADINGSFYDPNFLSFHLLPFWNESRSNSSALSTSNSSGLTGTAAIFTGSHTPGNVSYNWTKDSTGVLEVPGVAEVTTHGNSDSLSVNWGFNFSGLPSLNVGFTDGNSSYNTYGSNSEGSSHFKTFTANINDQLVGFMVSGGYSFTTTNSDTPQLFTTGQSDSSSSKTNSYSVTITHPLPFRGSASVGANRSNSDAAFNGVPEFTGTINTYNAAVSFMPITNLNVGANMSYFDNLFGALFQGTLASGGILTDSQFLNQKSHSFDGLAHATYTFLPANMVFDGNVEHREQSIFGRSLTSDSTTASASYSNYVLRGSLNGAISVNEYSTGAQSAFGYRASGGYERPFGRWNLGASGSYSRNQETVLIAYTTTGYTYAGSVGRKFAHGKYWGASANGSESHLNADFGTRSRAQSYSSEYSLRWIAFNGSYSKFNGNSILTTTGLAAAPVPVVALLPGSLLVFGGKAYSVGVGSNPKRGFTVSATYAKAFTDSQSSALSTHNSTEQLNVYTQYLFRKVYIRGGYNKLVQGFSVGGNSPAMLSSFYIGISRWFNLF